MRIIKAVGKEPSPALSQARLHLLAEAVRTRRAGLGLDREQLAQRARLDMSVISAIENADRGPGLEELFELADGLGMTAEALLRSAYREDNRQQWMPGGQRSAERPAGQARP